MSKSSYVVDDVSATPGVFNMVLQSNLPSVLARLAPGSGKYIVLDTNYKDFALIYSCTDFRLLHAGEYVYSSLSKLNEYDIFLFLLINQSLFLS